MPSIARDLDWIAVMTYDYHGHWDKKTGHVAPMYDYPEAEFNYFNTVSILSLFFNSFFSMFQHRVTIRVESVEYHWFLLFFK